MKLRRFSPVLLAGALCLLLSGCFVKTVDELYTLPRHSDEYDNLQMAIDEVMAADGCSYSAPVSGSNQQSVQLADLDGDGEEEAIVFARTAGEKPLKAYVFDKKDGAYQNVREKHTSIVRRYLSARFTVHGMYWTLSWRGSGLSIHSLN